MPGLGFSIDQLSDDELRGLALSVYDRHLAIERQREALANEEARLEAQAEEIAMERIKRGLPSFLEVTA